MKPNDTLEEPEKEIKIPVRTDGHPTAPEEESPEGDASTETDEAPHEEVIDSPADRPDLEVVIGERDRALAEKAELLEKFRRAQAEFENARKQLLRERQEVIEYAAMDTIRSLLPIVDDFERAISTPGINPELLKGLQLIYEQILDVFSRAGLKPVEEEGKFNPHFHHAVDKAPAETDEQDQDILEVYQKGYVFKDRLLRPAMVKVAVNE